MVSLQTLSPASDDAADLRRLAPGGAFDYLPRNALPRLARAKARVLTGKADALIAFSGTSLMMGAYAGGVAGGAQNASQSRPNGPNVRVAQMLTAAGLPATSRSFYGHGHNLQSTAFNFYDNRLALGSWATSSLIGLGAGGYGARATGAGTLAFSFEGAVDTVVIYEGRYGTAGAYSLDIDAGANIVTGQAVDTGTATVIKRTFTFSATAAGAHTLNIKWASGAPIILGAELFLSTAKAVRCLNVGVGGSNAANWAVGDAGSNFYGPGFVVPTIIAPDLVVFECAANDWLAQTDLTAYRASVVTALTRFKTASDVIALTPYPTKNAAQSSTTSPLATQQAYVDAFISASVERGVPVIDQWRRVGTQEAYDGLGMYHDTVHPSDVGALFQPDLISKALLAA